MAKRSLGGWLPLFLLLTFLFVFPVACDDEEAPAAGGPTPTSLALFSDEGGEGDREGGAAPAATTVGEPAAAPAASFVVQIDPTNKIGEISPLVYGVSGAPGDYLEALQPTLNSWGGNPSTRYNWRLGDAWNTGSDFFYRNTNYDYDPAATGRTAAENYAHETSAIDAAMRLAVPTLGWVARNNDLDTCSFPLPNGECGDGGNSTCKSPDVTADPTVTSVPSEPEDIRAWVNHLTDEEGYDIRFIAMDNEPELWGYTHYDVHPECTTYQEILDKFLTYAEVVQEAAPQAEITGPVTCCWEYYWHSAAGSRDELRHGNRDFLPWFLQEVRQHDQESGERSLDVLDIHFYPEGVYNDEVNERTAAHRLRSTRSLWDRNYTDESWIMERIALIPRMNELLEENYPGTRLAISEWNWGADETMNGALAIADVLGIMGREDLYFAAYWRYPPLDSPGYHAFKLYTNYDSQGSRFVGDAVSARSQDDSLVSSYAALDEEGTLRVMLINKQPERAVPVQVHLGDFPAAAGTRYRYDEQTEGGIAAMALEVDDGRVVIELPAYSITLLVIESE